MKLRIISFNIRYYNEKDGINHWDNRKASCLEIIKKYSPNIVGFQEMLFPQFGFFIKELFDYSWVGVGRENDKSGEGVPIFFKKNEFTLEENNTFWLSDTPGKPSKSWGQFNRIYTWALFKRKEDSTHFLFLNTHFDLMKKARLKSIPVVLEFITKKTKNQHNSDEIPAILIGDFNLFPNSEEYKKLAQNLRDAYLTDPKNQKSPNKDYLSYHDFTGAIISSNPELTRIDYSWITRQIKVNNANFIFDQPNFKKKIYPSDHWPLLVDFEI